MKRIKRNLWLALAAFVVAGAATPAMAQDGEAIVIFVPNLAPKQGADNDFGEDVAEDLRKMIGQLERHQTVSSREIRDARRQYKIDEDQLYNCITAKQLASRMGWGLVLCGEYVETGDRQVQVTASFQGATNQDVFEVPMFTANEREHEQAARQILNTFNRWETQLRHRTFCADYVQSQLWDQALENCNQALEIGFNESAQYQKSYILYQLDRNEEALEALNTLLEHNPIHGDGLKLAGIVATELEQPDVARGYFDRFIEQNPGDVGVRLTVAHEISNAGDPEAAMEFAREGLEIEPDNLTLHTYIGHYAVNAAVAAEAAIQGMNGQADGERERIKQLYSTAAESYQRVFEENGTETDPQVLEKLVVALVKLERYDEAISLGRRATEAKPDNGVIWEAYSRALQDSGQLEEAVAAMERAESLGRSTPGLTQRKALIQLQLGQVEEAVATLKQSVDAGELEAPRAFQTVFAYAFNEKYQKEQFDEALQMFEAAGPLAVAPNDVLARNFWRGYILFQQGQKAHAPMTPESARKAKPLFDRALALLKEAQGYERIQPSADVPKFIDAAQRFIDIQEALIKRGGGR